MLFSNNWQGYVKNDWKYNHFEQGLDRKRHTFRSYIFKKWQQVVIYVTLGTKQLSSDLDKKFNLRCFCHLWFSSSSFFGVSVAQDLRRMRSVYISPLHLARLLSTPLISEKSNCTNGTENSTFPSSSLNHSFYHFLLEPKLLPHPTGLERSEYQPTGRTCPTCIFLNSLLL